MTENATPSTKPQAPPKRHLKNFLLDKKFQLTYALIMVGVAVVATSILIALIWIQANNANKVAERQFDDTKAMHDHQSKEILGLFNKQSAKTQEVFTQESSETKEVFKKKTKQATDVLALLQTQDEFKEMAETMLKEIEQNDAKDIKARDEEIKKKEELLKKEIETVRVKKEAQLKAAKEKMDRDMNEAAALRRQNDLRIKIGVLAFSILFIVILFLYTIVLTHKVAGPLFKIARYLERMASNDLGPVWPLRKGDQLQEFYGHFEKAHNSVVAQCKKDIEVLAGAIEGMADGPAKDALVNLKTAKELSLEPPKKS
ncbi:hypothetical protein KKD52_18295 [Myxococcota bacterium]|jgi:hypothetical protein|nr:hypothetical protein [Myxococcota bacterium]MBU1512306.1 hypothetical protein [Myxococcota bacterium]PKN22807.1 MAG: hypothetical protein CVU65_14740 [Deltaproteobacteria bacterium HGW-Deltaproteobacteria-22]